MAEDLLDYAALVRRALLGVVRQVLERTAREGLPGEHHFYLTFRTDADGVELSPALRARHGEEMTIVLQNQFWDLEVDEERLAVSLRFDGRPQRIAIPFEALISFADPAVPLGLRFAAAEEPDAPGAGATPEPAADEGPRVVPFRPPRDPGRDQ